MQIGSIGGRVASPGLGPYSASKHAVMGLTKSAALEFDVTLEANTNYTAFAMDAEGGVQVIAAVDATGTAEMPDTALAQPTTTPPALLAGIVLIGLAIVAGIRSLAPRATR